MRIKNKDIAKALGISTTTVSLAINNKPGVSGETRRKVMQMIGEYADESMRQMEHPQTARRAVLLSIHKKSGVIINDKPFFSELIETIQQEAMHRSFILNVAHYVPGQDPDEYFRYLSSFQVEGIILLGTELTEKEYERYLKLGVPVVLMDASFKNKRIASVSLDNRDSILREMQYAVEMGHREIGYLKSSFPITNFDSRFEGFLDGIHRWHLEDAAHPVIELPCSMEESYQKMKEYLEHPPANFRMPTLFLSDLDYIAVGAMRAIREYGYRIPDDLSIIGYDDLNICTICDPPLTSTKVNQLDIGILSTDLLFRMIEEKRDIAAKVYIASELTERSSVRKLN